MTDITKNIELSPKDVEALVAGDTIDAKLTVKKDEQKPVPAPTPAQ